MDIHQQKEQLRAKLLKRRNAISGPEFEQASVSIIQKLTHQAEFQSAETIHCYVSMNDRCEVDTHGLIRQLFSVGKKVVVPVANFKEGTLTHILLDSFDKLESNKWGVLEPNGGKQLSTDELDLVVVPMVGGDEYGNRIGYGEGFYDRFLKEVGCPKIGLIFERNIVDKIPVESFDIPLEKIITEQRIIDPG